MNPITNFSQILAQQLLDSRESFPVDFDLAWHWIGYSNKANAKRSLKSSGILGNSRLIMIDECVNDTFGGSNPEKIWMSTDAFKHFAMMAQTSQGDKVREYFLECERVAKSIVKPQTALEVMQQSIALLVEHESRLGSIEAQNTLLIEQNQLLSSQVLVLKAQTDTIELETIANAAEIDRYSNGHGHYYTVSGWCNIVGVKLSIGDCNMMGRKAAAMCRIEGIKIEIVRDGRFGTVNSYPQSILEQLDFGGQP